MGIHTFVLQTTGFPALISLTVDSTVPYPGESTFDTGFTSRYDLDLSQDIIVSSGIESEYTDGEYGYFLPSETTIQFATLGIDAYAMQYFRESVKDVVISRNGQAIFRGNLDRKSVSYSFETRTLTAAFLPYIRPDRSIKSIDGAVDAYLFEQVFGVPYAQYDDGVVISDWINLVDALHSLLRWFGAVDVVTGDFGRYMTSVILQNRGSTIGETSTSGAAGWNGSTSLSVWLDGNKNFIFNRLYIYKRILFQDGKYESVGASTLLDVINNLCREIGAVMGVAPDGCGFIYPAYMVRSAVFLPIETILGVSVDGYIEKTSALVVAGGLYPLASYNGISPGMSFIPSVSTFGGVRYNSAGMHQAQYYSVSTLFTEDIDTGVVVKVCKFMHNPQQGHIPNGVGTDTFGYFPGATTTPGLTLSAIKYMGTEDYWNTNGTSYWLGTDVSAIVSIGCWYYSLYKVDREQITVSLDGVDYFPYMNYTLPGRYGGISIRPLSIQINLTQNTTSLTGISIVENVLNLPNGSVSGGGSEPIGAPILIRTVTGELIPQEDATDPNSSGPWPPWVADFTMDYIYTPLRGWVWGGISAQARYIVIIDSPGEWHLWLKACNDVINGSLSMQVDGDVPDQFSVQKDVPMYWQRVATKTLGAGSHVLILRYVNPFPLYKVSAIYLTKNGDTPTY